MRILLTNNTLNHRAGTELFVAELAGALLARGHQPIAWSPRLGAVAAQMRAATIPVVEDLDAIGEPPQLIHAQHHLETVRALLHFPGVPAIYVCHGWLPWEETPPRLPGLLRYVAVDHTVKDRLISECGIAADRVEVIFNWVDLARFAPRPPLPPRPRRALAFSNQAFDGGYVLALREGCRRTGLELELAGLSCGRVAEQPETLLAAYDVVFAKGRAALEAMAVGCAVVLADAAGAGPLVGPEGFDRLRSLNFGLRTLDRPHDSGLYAAELARYDPAGAAAVSARVRGEAGLEHGVARYLDLYHRVLAAAAEPPECGAERRAVERYLGWLSPTVKRAQELSLERAALDAQLAEAQATLDAMHRTVTWRLRSRLLHSGPGRLLYRWLRGSAAG